MYLARDPPIEAWAEAVATETPTEQTERRQKLIVRTDSRSYHLNGKLEPMSYKEAIKSKEAGEWKTAIEDEYNSLLANQTWTLANKLSVKILLDASRYSK